MIVLRTGAELRAHRAARAGRALGFVPTMGALHEGHLSLVRAAHEAGDDVLLSIFVNPRQFEDGGDFSAYPRDEARDLETARAAGVDAVFLPSAEEIYPPGFATTVSVGGPLVEAFEGAVRGRGHFDGMATVVTRLLLAVRPDAAYFGEKDLQQLLVVRRLVGDLGLPVRIVGCPTSREPDGLARSSRNVRLTPEERRRAAAIPRALAGIAADLGRGERDASRLEAAARGVLEREGLDCEYLALVDPDTLEAVPRISGPTACLLAVRVGATRLIDNARLLPEPLPTGPDGG